MARIFDIDASTLEPGPIVEWPGQGATFSYLYGAPAAVDGAVRFHAGDSMRWSVPLLDFAAGQTPVALHLAAAITGPIDGGEQDFATWGGWAASLPWNEGGFGRESSPFPISDGAIAVYSVISDDDSTRLYVDGVLVGASEEPLSAFGNGLDLMNFTTAAVIDTRRLVGSRGATAELVAEMNALATEYGSVTIHEVAGLNGSAQWVGSATATAADLWLPPTPRPLFPGGSQEPPPEPPEQAPPVRVRTEPIRRHSEIMPVPTLDERGAPLNWSPTSVVREPVGRLQIVIEGVDVTYWDEVETPFPSWSRVEPFGSDQATIRMPQISAFHELGAGALAWCREGANVTIKRIIPDAPNVRVWRGVIASFAHDEDSGIFTIECLGYIFAADLQLRTPPFLTEPMDVGRLVARTLNQTVGRRFRSTSPVTTGCMASVQGGWEPRVTGLITQVLSTAVTDGRQWTVKCDDRQPVIELKDTETVHWTVRNGQRGINVQLRRDVTQAPNVIYGEGITPEGGRWRNAKYPNWRQDDTPTYPGPMVQGMTVGFRDAQTSNGRGVSVWQEKAGQRVTGVLSQADRLAWRRIQADAGVTVDNFLGPQTWAATFQTGSNTGTLDGAFVRPLARSSEVDPYRYSPDGDILGDNPRFNPDVLRVERYINFGAGVDKSAGRRAAQEMLARDSDPGWVGTVTFTLDPNEGSKYDVVREGTNGRIRSFRGETLLVHVARVEYDGDRVVATVDTNARDYPTLDAILDRERSATDPARAYRRQTTSGTISSDRATWDVESPGGRVPQHAVFGGLWNVLRIPFAHYGTVVRTRFTATSPATSFSVAVFDRPVTAARLVSMVGNPLTADSNPWQSAADQLDDAGLLMAWGWKEQPGGYYPREYSNPEEKGAAPITGRMVDDSSWEYASTQPPWLWVAVIAGSSCQLEGRFWQGPL